MSATIEDMDAGRGRLVVVCRGELDLSNAPDLRASMIRAIETGKRHLVVDLTEVTFLDSTVMTVLVERRRELAARDGTLGLVGVDSDVRAIFDIAGLDRAIPQYRSREEAFAAADGS